jgi:serpin B
VESTDRFGLKLFREIVRTESDSNIFISPLSASMALGMTANGAAGSTMEAMRNTLELDDLTEEQSNEAYKSLIELLTSADPKVRFDIANSIWPRLGLTVVEDFLERCNTYFSAEVRELDFNDPGAAGIVNSWAEEKTNGKIDQIVSEQDLLGALMVLMNALYFKGTWTYEFDPADTQDDHFTRSDGTQVPCKMMNLETELDYLDTGSFQAVDMPYGDGLFSMTILLPRSEIHVDSVITQMTPENWGTWVAGFETAEMNLQLPKFALEYNLKMNDVLMMVVPISPV